MHMQNYMRIYVCIFLLIKVKHTVTETAADQNQMITPEHSPMSVSYVFVVPVVFRNSFCLLDSSSMSLCYTHIRACNITLINFCYNHLVRTCIATYYYTYM